MTAVELLASAQIVRALILVSAGDGAAMERDVRALSSEKVVLHAAIEVSRGGRCTWITGAPAVSGRCRSLAATGPELSVRWSKIEADRAAYDNVPGGVFKTASIGWIESPWTSGAWSVPADIQPIARRGIPYFAGTMRYRVHISLPDGRDISSPGLFESPGGPSASTDIRKVQLRLGDDYLGLMTELGNVPYIFGSTELGREAHQAERGIGVDCADLVIYGLKRAGHDLMYRSSRTLSPISKHIAASDSVRDRGGAELDGAYLDGKGRAIPIGTRGVLPGDWVIFSGHVGVFYEDRGIIGAFDERDLLMHIAWKELAIEAMIDSGYGEVPFEVRRAHALISK